MAREPGLSVRLKLTLSYAGFLMLAGVLLLAVVWVFLLRYVPDRDDQRAVGFVPNRSDLLDAFAPRAAVVMAFLLVFGLVGGWILAGRMLAPLTRITDGHAHGRERVALPPDPARGPQATSSASSPTPSTRCSPGSKPRSPNSSGSPPTPPTSCARRWRSRRPCSTSPARIRTATHGELLDRLYAVNARAIDLTEALLLLSRTDQRSFTREPVDLSLIAEEATETLLPLAEQHGVTIRTSGEITPTVGSHALLLQMTTNLLHNAIVHNLPEHGTVQVTTGDRPRVRRAHGREHRRDSSRLSWSRRSPNRSSAAPNASAVTTPVSASAWRSSRASRTHTTGPSRSSPARTAGSASRRGCHEPDHPAARYDQGMIELRSRDEIDAMRPAGRFVAAVLAELTGQARVGMNVLELDRIAHAMIREHRATSCYIDYHPSFGAMPFGKALCVSVTDAVLHGLPRDRRLRDGDLVSLDFAAEVDGWVADSAITIPVGTPRDEDLRQIQAAERALTAGIAAAQPGNHLGDISAAVGGVIRGAGYQVNTAFGGHGVGRVMHGPADVRTTGSRGAASPCGPASSSRSSPGSLLGARRSASTATAGPSGRWTSRGASTSSTPWRSPPTARSSSPPETRPWRPAQTVSDRGSAVRSTDEGQPAWGPNHRR